MLERLARAMRDRKVVLFAGAGLSVPLKLPTWSGLMRRVAEELDYDPDVLMRPGADYLQLAEYYRLEKGGIGPLKSWMDRSWDVSDDCLQASKVHEQIVDLKFPFIYTTNYDRNIERMFDLRGQPYSKIVSVFDVADARPDQAHIVKFHGDFDDESSLVLTESDYFDRLDFESPMDIKFRSDILGRSVLFVGYSLSDLNLRVLLYRMDKLWKSSKFAEKRPESFIFLLRPDPVQERVLLSRGVHAIVYDGDDPDNALPELFDKLLEAVEMDV
ncbi:SIR2 family protein [Novosphingobium sp. P6W]|uniref:SIR2 family protein n=1 Tax=Novosphingobium sp. P6W TaxID=1609758 RepID=UPI0005C2A634|nr:SIR2 family protein [Novosphingobium sp. P6W]AXB75911.1 Sir2 family NAD-dependent protein deacetylase [Novosphingobium sp. P6W]KIS29922.1 Sir2 family NAD-dependent protein deacetylase [Novosphingobium sp. P6W]